MSASASSSSSSSRACPISFPGVLAQLGTGRPTVQYTSRPTACVCCCCNVTPRWAAGAPWCPLVPSWPPQPTPMAFYFFLLFPRWAAPATTRSRVHTTGGGGRARAPPLTCGAWDACCTSW